MDKYDILYEKVMNKLPTDVKEKINRKSVRTEMPDDAFLIPGDKKFPIKRPGEKEVDCKLIYAAYIRAKQWSSKKPQYEKIASTAKNLFNKNKCATKLHLQIEESFSLDDKNLKQILNLLENENEKVDDKTKDDLDTCICPKCGAISALDIDDAICEEKECPVCKAKMTDSIFENKFISTKLQEQETIVDKMKFLTEHTMGKNRGKPGEQFICSECKTILDFHIKESELGFCPKCGELLRLLKEEEKIITEEKRNICPKCNTSTQFSIRESDCPICQSRMVVFNKLKIKQDKAVPLSD